MKYLGNTAKKQNKHYRYLNNSMFEYFLYTNLLTKLFDWHLRLEMSYLYYRIANFISGSDKNLHFDKLVNVIEKFF